MLLRFFARALVALPVSLLLFPCSSFLLLLLLLLGDTNGGELKLDRREDRGVMGRVSRAYRVSFISALPRRSLLGTAPYISGLSRRLRQQVAVRPEPFTLRPRQHGPSCAGRAAFASMG